MRWLQGDGLFLDSVIYVRSEVKEPMVFSNVGFYFWKKKKMVSRNMGIPNVRYADMRIYSILSFRNVRAVTHVGPVMET